MIDTASASSVRIARSTSPNLAANARPSRDSTSSPPPGSEHSNELTYPSMTKGCHIVGLA